MTAPLLEVSGLAVRFGGVAALDGLDLALAPGAPLGLIGANGAGKSTLLKCLTGQLRPSAGRIRLGGTDVTGWPPHALAAAGIGLKTQTPSLFETLTVAEHCRLAARGAADAALLARLGLTDCADTPVERLSHGKRQMAELAAVLAARPRLALLDEPTAGLTPEEADRVARAVRGLAGETAVIAAAHDMRFIAALDCPVAALAGGRIAVRGAFARVIADPAVAAAWLGETPPPAASPTTTPN